MGLAGQTMFSCASCVGGGAGCNATYYVIAKHLTRWTYTRVRLETFASHDTLYVSVANS